MIFEFTDAEKAKIDKIYEYYDNEIKKSEVIVDQYENEAHTMENLVRENKGRAITDINKIYEEIAPAEVVEARKRGAYLLQEKIMKLKECHIMFERNHFNLLGDDPDAVLEDGLNQVSLITTSYYNEILTLIEKGGEVSDIATRVDNDKLVIDTEQAISMVKQGLWLHYEYFRSKPEHESYIDKLDNIVTTEIYNRLYISDKGEINKRFNTEDITVPVVKAKRPNKYTTTVDRISNLVFQNELTSEKYFPVALTKDKNTPNVYASINYDSLKDINLTLSDNARWVHDSIITNLLCGNRTMTIPMIYRGMTGKIHGDVTISEDIEKIIKDSLRLFRRELVIDNEPDYNKNSNKPHFVHKEPLVMYKWDMVEMYGQKVEAISIPEGADPILLKWARFNGEELDTRDINLLNVKGLYNGKESASIKMYLYRRVIAMKRDYDISCRYKKRKMKLTRTIKLEAIYEKVNAINPTAKKASAIKSKIERILTHWVNGGLITGYKFNRENRSGKYRSVTIDFIPKLNKK